MSDASNVACKRQVHVKQDCEAELCGTGYLGSVKSLGRINLTGDPREP